MTKIKLGNKQVGKGEPCFIIAEIGSNHDGKLKQAKKLIGIAKEAGADAVKFQIFSAASLYLTTTHFYKILKKIEIPLWWCKELSDYAKRKNIIFLSTPFSKEAVGALERISVPAYKIASGDLTYLPLIEYIARFHKPIILSTGMAYLNEVKKAVDTIKKAGNNKIILLHCVSNYPPRIEDVSLRALLVLTEKFHLPIGLSDHSLHISLPLAAVALGASVIEKHLTLDRKLKGPDHPFALQPDEFKTMVNEIRVLEKALGTKIKRPAKSEMGERKMARRSIYAGRDIKAGDKIAISDIKIVRPFSGLPPEYLNRIIGRTAKINIKEGSSFSLNMLNR